MKLVRWLVFGLLLFLACAILYPMELISQIDVSVTLFFETIRSSGLTKLAIFLSDMGSIKYYLPLCIIASVLLLIKHKVFDIIFLFIILFSVRLLNNQLKDIFIRERPNFNAIYEATHYSFPSGHSMNSMAIYSFLYYVLSSQILKTDNQRYVFMIITIILIILIGISRVYLGVHYLTDVIAGFGAGIVWFIMIKWLFAKIRLYFDKNRTI